MSARPHGFRDIPVHVHKNGTAWAGMPGKRQLEDGHLKLDPNGKALYPAAVDWKDKALRDRFSNARCRSGDNRGLSTQIEIHKYKV